MIFKRKIYNKFLAWKAESGGKKALLVEGITEELKAIDPMVWIQRMNNITARAEEIIREELIYNG